MAGLRGVVMMQTSGFALLANALASVVMPYHIPAIMVISSITASAPRRANAHCTRSAAREQSFRERVRQSQRPPDIFIRVKSAPRAWRRLFRTAVFHPEVALNHQANK